MADELKSRMDLLPWDALQVVGQVAMFGAQKHGLRAWESDPLITLDDHKAAMLRHYAKHAQGITHDKESGLPHAAHMAWRALAILALTLRGTKSESVIPGMKRYLGDPNEQTFD